MSISINKIRENSANVMANLKAMVDNVERLSELGLSVIGNPALSEDERMDGRHRLAELLDNVEDSIETHRRNSQSMTKEIYQMLAQATELGVADEELKLIANVAYQESDAFMYETRKADRRLTEVRRRIYA